MSYEERQSLGRNNQAGPGARCCLAMPTELWSYNKNRIRPVRLKRPIQRERKSSATLGGEKNKNYTKS